MSVEDQSWQTPMEEVFKHPDCNSTTFLWQILSRPSDVEAPESWELDEDQWYCLPLLWQQVLNRRLSAYNASVQDAHAVFLNRLETCGEEHIKTRNAKKKHDAFCKQFNRLSISFSMFVEYV